MTDVSKTRNYVEIGRLLESLPTFPAKGVQLTNEHLRWLGSAYGIADSILGAEQAKTVKEITDHITLLGVDRSLSLTRLMALLYRALALASRDAPVEDQGTFISAANVFEAFASVGKIISSSKQSVFIIDPYLDATVLTDFAPSIPEGVSIDLLADLKDVKPDFAPAVQRWIQQYGQKRPLIAKLAPAKSLHDRLVIIDDTTVYDVTQSFNGLAKRSPASIVRSNAEMTPRKVAHFRHAFANAVPVN